MVAGTWLGSVVLAWELLSDGFNIEDLVDKLKAKSTTHVPNNVVGEGRQGANHRPWT
jgi:hypothetical protein